MNGSRINEFEVKHGSSKTGVPEGTTLTHSQPVGNRNDQHLYLVTFALLEEAAHLSGVPRYRF